MPTPKPHKNSDGTISWRVRFRIGGRGTNPVHRTFSDIGPADWFCNLIDQLGPAEAARILDERQGVAAGPTRLWTLTDWCNHYIDHLSGVTDGTRGRYRGYVKRDLGKLAQLPLEVVDKDRVRAWVNELEKAPGRKEGTTASGKTIKNKHGFLSGALSAAVEAKLIDANPCRGVRLPSTEREEMTFLTHDEYHRFLSCVPAYWRPLVMTLFTTGVRWGEASALKVGDVDLNDAYMRISRAWKETESGAAHATGAPKSSAGRRTVALAPEVVAALKPLVEGRPADAWLFVGKRGGVVRQQTFHDMVWYPSVRLANGEEAKRDRGRRPGRMVDEDGTTLKPLPKSKQIGKRPRVHDARHTNASWLLARGVPPTVVQDHLGHESFATTDKLYRHLMPSAREEVRSAISAALTVG
jgi:integrase